MVLVDIEAAQRDLAELVQRAERGEEIVIARDGTPVAKIIPAGEKPGRRVFGSLRGQLHIADDFDAPLPPDVLAGFYGDE